MVSQISQMTKDSFLSLSDDAKLKMHRQQFYIEPNEWDEVHEWLAHDNLSGPYYIEQEDKKIWILLYDETDAVAFKLRWV